MKDDHGNYIRNFCSCEKKARKKKFRLVRQRSLIDMRDSPGNALKSRTHLFILTSS